MTSRPTARFRVVGRDVVSHVNLLHGYLTQGMLSVRLRAHNPPPLKPWPSTYLGKKITVTFLQRFRRRVTEQSPAVAGPAPVRAMNLKPGTVLTDGSTVLDVTVSEFGPERSPVDRSAGRYCAVCAQHGSHHTDKHDEFMTAAIRVQVPSQAAPVMTYRPGTDLVAVTSVPA